MIRLALPILLLVAGPALARDPRCDTAARYDAMRDADRSGWGTGHACAERKALNADLAKPCRPSGAKFGCRTVRQ